MNENKVSFWRREIVSNFTVFGGGLLLFATCFYFIYSYKESLSLERRTEILAMSVFCSLLFNVFVFVRLLKKT